MRSEWAALLKPSAPRQSLFLRLFVLFLDSSNFLAKNDLYILQKKFYFKLIKTVDRYEIGLF